VLADLRMASVGVVVLRGADLWWMAVSNGQCVQ